MRDTALIRDSIRMFGIDGEVHGCPNGLTTWSWEEVPLPCKLARDGRGEPGVTCLNDRISTTRSTDHRASTVAPEPVTTAGWLRRLRIGGRSEFVEKRIPATMTLTSTADTLPTQSVRQLRRATRPLWRVTRNPLVECDGAMAWPAVSERLQQRRDTVRCPASDRPIFGGDARIVRPTRSL